MLVCAYNHIHDSKEKLAKYVIASQNYPVPCSDINVLASKHSGFCLDRMSRNLQKVLVNTLIENQNITSLLGCGASSQMTTMYIKE